MSQLEGDETSIHEKNNYKRKPDFPFEIIDVDPRINEELLQNYHGERTGFIQVGEKKWFFPVKFRDHLASFYNLTVRPTDVWIVSYPRTGTTVTQEMIWLLLNNLDYGKASSTPLEIRFPFMEADCTLHPDVHAELLTENMHSEDNHKYVENLSNSIRDYLDQMKERRFIKTHMPFSLLPQNLLTAGCKVIYLARNPMDVAISFYHLGRLIRFSDFRNDFPTFWNHFSNNLVIWTPYWEHVFEGWERRNEENLLFLFYENMKKDLKETILTVQNFLGSKFTDDQLNKLENHLKIENFRLNNSVNLHRFYDLGIFRRNDERGFIRNTDCEGEQYFNDQLRSEANEWIEKHLKNTDFKFPNF